MDRELLKKKICDTIDANREKIIEIGRSIYANPELGYKETFASGRVKEVYDELGLKYEDGLAVTGIKARLKEGTAGPNVAIMGELDAVVCPDHPNADPLYVLTKSDFANLNTCCLYVICSSIIFLSTDMFFS